MYYTLYFMHVKLFAGRPLFFNEICQYCPYINITITIALICYYIYVNPANVLIFCRLALLAIALSH